MKLSLMISAKCGKTHVSYLRRYVLRAHAILHPPLNEMSLALVGDRVMAELHVRYMDIAGPTDVLTFPLEEDTRGRVTSGEVVVCVPEANRRAKQAGIPVQHELLLYALHGMLHLCGFDDRTAADFERMHRKEDQILSKLGIGAVFDHSQHHSPPRTARRTR